MLLLLLLLAIALDVSNHIDYFIRIHIELEIVEINVRSSRFNIYNYNP